MIFWGVGAAVVAVVVLGAVRIWKAFGPCGEFFDEDEWGLYDPYLRAEGE